MNFLPDVLGHLEQPFIPALQVARQSAQQLGGGPVSQGNLAEQLLDLTEDFGLQRPSSVRLISNIPGTNSQNIPPIERFTGAEPFGEVNGQHKFAPYGVNHLTFAPARASMEALTELQEVNFSCASFSLAWQGLKQAWPFDNANRSLEGNYVIENRETVTKFIEVNRLRSLLSQAVSELNAAFGSGTIKTLKLLSDDEGSVTLFCMISVTGDMENALRALRCFDERWWLAHCDQVAGKLNFDFELV